MPVAIKYLNTDSDIQQIENELNSLLKIRQHPYIVKCIEFYCWIDNKEDPITYKQISLLNISLVFPYAQTDLQKLLREKKEFSE
jgi:hypothetical protein